MIENIKKLIVGSAIAKLIGIMLMPLITRLYLPEDMGKAAQFMSIVLIVAPMLNLRYCLAVPLPKRDNSARILVYSSVFFTLVLSIVLILGIYFFKPFVVDFLGIKGIDEYLYLLIVASCLLSIQEVFSFWVTRVKGFKLISRVILKQSLVGGGVKVILGLFFPVSISLIIGNIIQNISGIGSYFLNFRQKNIKIRMKFSNWLSILKYYLNYVYLKVPAHLMYVLAAQLPVLYCSKHFDMHNVGQLSLAMSLISIPIGVISQSVSKVYYAEISSLGKFRMDEIYHVTILTLKKITCFSVFMALLIYYSSPILFTFAFGEKWSLAGGIASVLSFTLVFQTSASTLITSLNVMNLNFLSFFIHATRLFLIFITFYVANIFRLDIKNTILCYSLALAFHYLLVITTIAIVMKRRV